MLDAIAANLGHHDHEKTSPPLQWHCDYAQKTSLAVALWSSMPRKPVITAAVQKHSTCLGRICWSMHLLWERMRSHTKTHEDDCPISDKLFLCLGRFGGGDGSKCHSWVSCGENKMGEDFRDVFFSQQPPDDAAQQARLSPSTIMSTGFTGINLWLSFVHSWNWLLSFQLVTMDAEMDERFKHIGKDPRFRQMGRKERKVRIDKRFQAMFTDKKFKVKYTVDKRGRPVQTSTSENLRKFYDLSDSEGSDEDQSKAKKTKAKAKKDKKESKKARKKDLVPSKRTNKAKSNEESNRGIEEGNSSFWSHFAFVLSCFEERKIGKNKCFLLTVQFVIFSSSRR